MGKDSDKQQADWSPEMTVALLEALIDEVKLGKRLDTGFQISSYQRACEEVNKKLDGRGYPPNLGVSQVRSKVNTSHPRAAKFRKHKLHHYKELTELFTASHATEEYEKTHGQLTRQLIPRSWPVTTPAPSRQVRYQQPEEGIRDASEQSETMETGGALDQSEEPQQPDIGSSRHRPVVQGLKRKASDNHRDESRRSPTNFSSARHNRKSAGRDLAKAKNDLRFAAVNHSVSSIERAIIMLEEEYPDLDAQEMAVAYMVFKDSNNAKSFVVMTPGRARDIWLDTEVDRVAQTLSATKSNAESLALSKIERAIAVLEEEYQDLDEDEKAVAYNVFKDISNAQ
ncbi:hypothetical protein BZA77DRAFT_345457 [Pyronema omphalodes]|nr:hypothetical protein BZA77DRAFT_345457 [Pyronema omphalodes]